MALDAVEQELYDFAMASMPPWYKARARSKEEVSAMAKQKGAVKKLASYWLGMCLIGQATGPQAKTSGWDADWLTPIASGMLGPDWLELHAGDQGTRRAGGEPDAVLRQRLVTPPDAITRAALLRLAQAIVTAAGVSGTVDMVEFPRDAAYLGTYSQNTGTGGTFLRTGDVVTFIPTVPFAYPPYFAGVSGRVKGTRIAISGAASAGNDGTFDITGMVVANDGEGDPTLTGVTFTNINGVAGADAGAAWATERLDYHGSVMDGHGRAFVNRGYRVWRGQSVSGAKKAMGGVLLILPYGTTDSTRRTVAEMLRTSKAAGFAGIVERRENP